jgi:hypothetical protein
MNTPNGPIDIVLSMSTADTAALSRQPTRPNPRPD